jgi:hypothetical protein
MTAAPTIILPKPEIVIPGFAELPEPIQALIERLSTPFPIEEVKVRPGAVRRDGTAALCLAYSDWWTGYLPRLNDEIGPNNWSIVLRPWGEHQIIARLRAFGGLIEKESSGSAKGEANGAQEAEVQAKKRACAEGLMLGLYYYFLPNVWGKGERVGKDFTFADGEEQRCVYEMYARAGLIARSTPSARVPRDGSTAGGGASRPAATTPTPSSAPEAAPVNMRAATARRSLEQAERRVGLRQPSHDTPTHDPDVTEPHPGTITSALASDAQLGLIARLITDLRTNQDATSEQTAATLDALGAHLGITSLSSLRSKADLRRVASRLTKLQAMQLIDRLKALASSEHAQAA